MMKIMMNYHDENHDEIEFYRGNSDRSTWWHSTLEQRTAKNQSDWLYDIQGPYDIWIRQLQQRKTKIIIFLVGSIATEEICFLISIIMTFASIHFYERIIVEVKHVPLKHDQPRNVLIVSHWYN